MPGSKLLFMMGRDQLEHIIMLWAANSGLVEEREVVEIDWLHNEVEVLDREQPIYIRLSYPEGD